MDAREFVQLVAVDVRERSLITEHDSVLAAVSGGPDSVCLLFALRDLATDFGFTLRAAHFNHGIRDSSDADEEFVRTLCGGLGVWLVTQRSASLGPEASEEEARDERLAFLQRAALETGCSLVATGHTADDLAETVLLNIFRGTGTTGLAGIRWRSGTFIRPLLGRRRSEVIAYLAECSQPFRIDESNADTTFARNRIRHNVLPMLESELGSHVREALLRLAESAGEDSILLDDLARGLFVKATLPSSTSDALNLDCRALSAAPAPLGLRAVRIGMGEMLGGLRDVSLLMCRRALHAAREPSAPLDIGLGLRVYSDAETLTIERSVAEQPPAPFDMLLPETGELRLPEAGWLIRVQRPDAARPVAEPVLRLLIRRPEAPLRIRSWQPGDRIRPRGLGGTRKLQDVFTDAKLPRRERHTLPLLCCGDDVLWIPGLAVSELAQSSEPDLLVLLYSLH